MPEIDFSMDRMIQNSLMATALSSSPFVIYGIWCTFGLFFRHSTCWGWGWVVCFIFCFLCSDILETGTTAMSSLAYRYLPMQTVSRFLPAIRESLENVGRTLQHTAQPSALALPNNSTQVILPPPVDSKAATPAAPPAAQVTQSSSGFMS